MEMELPSIATNLTSPTNNTIFKYAPSKSSPLSSRSNNFNAASFSSPPPQMKLNFYPLSPPRSPPSHKAMAAKRKFRPNPLMRCAEDARERRRNLFLKKLKTNREEKIMQARGGEEEMMRMIFVSEKKRWEHMHERAASTLVSEVQISPEDEEAEMLALLEQSDQAQLADEMLDVENQELDFLIHSHYDNQQQPDQTAGTYNQVDHDMMDTAISGSQSMDQDTSLQMACRSCGSDELVTMANELVCFNCGWACTT